MEIRNFSSSVEKKFTSEHTNELPNHFTLIVFSCERYVAIAMVLFSHVKISSFRAKAQLVFHWCLYSK